MGNTYNRVYIWCCKYGENRYCERCANKKLSASKHTGLLNSCLGKLCLHPYLVVSLISARVTLIPTRVSAHCQAILLLLQWAEKWGRCILETHLISTHCGLASDAIWQHKSRSTLAKVMACCLMALPQTMLTHHHWGSVAITLDQFHMKGSRSQFVKSNWKYTYRYFHISQGLKS